MFFVLLGTLLLLMKWLQVGPVAALGWPWVLAPFGLALLWWAWSDSSGLTRRREMDKLEARKEERRRRNMVSLGLETQGQKRVGVFKNQRKAEAQRIEAEREAQRKRNREAVASSQHGDGPGLGPRG